MPITEDRVDEIMGSTLDAARALTDVLADRHGKGGDTFRRGIQKIFQRDIPNRYDQMSTEVSLVTEVPDTSAKVKVTVTVYRQPSREGSRKDGK